MTEDLPPALTAAARSYQRSRRAHRAAGVELRDAVRVAHAAGVSEVALARVCGVTRMTIRSWLGKQPGSRS